MEPLNQQFREMLEQMGNPAFDGLADELEGGEAVTGVRLNPAKEGEKTDVATMEGGEKVGWCESGRILRERPQFTLDPQLHQGRYYVQDPSSMILSQIAEALASKAAPTDGRPLRYLDACAAPGGKTTAAVAALPEDAFVVANEYDFRRAEILKENVIKWGSGNVTVTRGDTVRMRKLPGFFDIVAADVPCSGEGMMRKDEQARRQWSPALVKECAERQREIVGNLWEALRPGGYFIYSTCTFNYAENEDIISLLKEEFGGEEVALATMLKGLEGVEAPRGMLRFIPGRVKGEGLAVGVVRKPEDAPCGGERRVKNKEKRQGKGKKGAEIPNGWLAEGWMADVADEKEGTLRAVREEHRGMLEEVERHLDVIYAGVESARMKGKTLIPSHALAMSRAMKRGAFPEVEVDRETALTYLRHEALGGLEAPRGAVLLTFKGYALGFVNHLGNRANNLYPERWRVLKRGE